MKFMFKFILILLFKSNRFFLLPILQPIGYYRDFLAIFLEIDFIRIFLQIN